MGNEAEEEARQSPGVLQGVCGRNAVTYGAEGDMKPFTYFEISFYPPGWRTDWAELAMRMEVWT